MRPTCLAMLALALGLAGCATPGGDATTQAEGQAPADYSQWPSAVGAQPLANAVTAGAPAAPPPSTPSAKPAAELATALAAAVPAPVAAAPSAVPATPPSTAAQASAPAPAPAPVSMARLSISRIEVGQWEHFRLPGKRATRFEMTRVDGRTAMRATSASSASMLRQRVRIEGDELRHLQFSWKVPELIAEADMASREHEDSPVRIVLAFEGDRDRLSARDRMMSEMAQALTGEPMPYATLMYVWCNKRPAGTVIHNPRTDRIRKLVVESGRGNLNQWLSYERDVQADYERAFGEKPGALIGIGIMTDSDNTRSKSRVWYGPVRLSRERVAMVSR